MSNFRDILSEKSRSPSLPKTTRFYLNRVEDESGVSGTGIVAVGVKFPSGRCIIEWTSTRSGVPGLGIYDDMEGLKKIHGHDGKTQVKYYDGDEEKDTKDEEESSEAE